MDAVITVDEAQRVVQFNAAAEHAFRWPRDAVLGQRLDMLLPASLRDAHRGHVDRFGATAVTSRGMGHQMVIHGLRADGTEFPIEASISQHLEGGGKRFTVILRDVTERERAAEALARSETRLRGILDSAMDAIITVDEKQHILLFNAAAEAVFGCPREQAVGAPLAWFIPERFRDGHVEHLRHFGEAGVSSKRMAGTRIVKALRRNGEEFPIEASISQTAERGQRFYTVILRDVSERVRAEAALEATRQELRDLSLAASNLREQEKKRIARELHDELGQALTALKIDAGWLRDHLSTSTDAPARQKLAAMEALLDGTVASTRRISSDLRPLILDDLGLAAAAEWLAQAFTTRTGVPCELTVERGDLDLADPHATAVFRVLQESLTNIAKHAAASKVDVTFDRVPGEIRLTVADDGRGFVPGAPTRSNAYGLIGVRERAELLGGTVRIESTPGRGTRVELRLPLDEVADT
jgi:PAS domain S-box-containing protein